MKSNKDFNFTLLGSFISTYLPSGNFIHKSMTVLTIPHPFETDKFIWAAKSRGL